MSYLKDLDYSVLQQCMHCGMCLPTCPTYVETKIERNSPRGRISLMRAIADGEMAASKAFADEMYFCLGLPRLRNGLSGRRRLYPALRDGACGSGSQPRRA